MHLRVRARETVRMIESVSRRRGLHNELRPHFSHRFVDLLVAKYKQAAVRAYQRKADDALAANVTSMFDRDSTLDVSVAAALVRGEAPPEGWNRSCAPGCAPGPRCGRRSTACGRCSRAPSS
jgi:hypothetical protein